MIEIRNLVKIYNRETAAPVTALNDISCTFPSKGIIFVLGKSGSGKTTLLNMLGGWTQQLVEKLLLVAEK